MRKRVHCLMREAAEFASKGFVIAVFTFFCNELGLFSCHVLTPRSSQLNQQKMFSILNIPVKSIFSLTHLSRSAFLDEFHH